MTYRNPELYKALCNFAGRDKVKVEKPGQTGNFYHKAEVFGGSKTYRMAKKDGYVGEEFRIDCPFCLDTKQRLYLNHLWGTVDSLTNSRILWLAQCFNESCTSDFENRKQLFEMIYGDAVRPIYTDDLNAVEETPKPEIKVRLPGELVPLDILARNKPDHEAINWCYARGLDPYELSNVYGVGYCVLARKSDSVISRRLVVPIYDIKKGVTELVAWTARKLADDRPGPKWMHSVAPMQNILYGIGTAAKYQTIVVVEGPGDKWSVGLNAVAMFNKIISPGKASILAKVINRRKQPEKSAIVILLDPMQDAVAISKGKRHHIETACDLLTSQVQCPVLPVYLPKFADPGSLDSSFIWACIKKASWKENIYVSRHKKCII